METELYNGVNEKSGARRDVRLVILILLAAAMIAGFVYLTSILLRVEFNYTQYKKDLAHCIVCARQDNTFTVYEGAEPVNRRINDELCSVLSAAGHGRPIKKTPEAEPDITLDFGKNGIMKLWKTVYEDRSSGEPELVDGYTLLFEPAEGRRYLIENNGSFEELRRFLKG